jgi:microcystin-dependent protein
MTNDMITTKISELYKADINAIRNLSKLANDLTKNGSLSVKGGLKVDGPLDFLPKGSIIAWNGTNAPKGWAVCDGSIVENYQTPDLRGRFIRMHTDGKVSGNYEIFPMNVSEYDFEKGYSKNTKKTYIAKQNFNETGGSDFVNLTINEIPAHNHTMDYNGDHHHNLNSTYKVMAPRTYNRNFGGGSYTGYDRAANDAKQLNEIDTNTSGSHTHTINNTGKGESHNNTPPYYVLTWIVKVI